jgi:hypothetical protein
VPAGLDVLSPKDLGIVALQRDVESAAAEPVSVPARFAGLPDGTAGTVPRT